jgi:hypothetical protein
MGSESLFIADGSRFSGSSTCFPNEAYTQHLRHQPQSHPDGQEWAVMTKRVTVISFSTTRQHVIASRVLTDPRSCTVVL